MEELKAALLLLGLSEAQAAFYAKNTKIEENVDIDALAKEIKAIQPETIAQSDVDRQISKALETFKKNQLEDKKPEVKPEIKTEGLSPEMKAIFEAQEQRMKTLLESVNVLTGQKKAEERGVQIKNALTEAGIPENKQALFNVSEDVTGEDLTTAIAGYKQQLADFGVEILLEPNGGGGAEKEFLKQVEQDSKNISEGVTADGNIKGKEINIL